MAERAYQSRPYRPSPAIKSQEIGDITISWSTHYISRMFSIRYKGDFVGQVSWFQRPGSEQKWFIFAQGYPGNTSKEWEHFNSKGDAIKALLRWYLSKRSKS